MTRLSQHKLLWILLIALLLNPSFVLHSYAVDSTATQSPAGRTIDKPFYDAVASSHLLADRLQEQVNGFLLLPQEMAAIWEKVAMKYSPGYPFLLIFQICFVFLAGILLESFLRNKLSTVYDSISNSSTDGVTSRVLHICFRVALEGLFLFSFILVTFSLYVFIFPEKGIAATIASNYILAGYYIRVLLFLITIFLSPGRPLFRILPFSDEAARYLAIWSFWLCSIEILLARSAMIMKKSGADQSALLAITGLIIASTTIILASMIIQRRRQVRDALCHSFDDQPADSLSRQLSRHWQLAAFLLLLFVTTIWEIRVLDSGKIHFGKIIISLLALPVFFSLDVWGRRLLQMVFIKSGTDENEPGSLLKRIGGGKYLQHIQSAFRLLLLAMLLFFFLSLFRVDVAIGRMFTAGVLTSIFIVILFYLSWQFFSGWVDKKIREEIPEDEEADEGGKGGSRRGTLLLLLRKFTMVLIVVIATMLILPALGLNIAPLVAGAGILGLAISFGSQALVTDIFAGIFFMIDDAFRVGDYIDTGTAKGLVEHISLRAVRLRHHRGMIQTVPFGKIGTVVNFSRDYIIMKLDFRVRYDTDVDKVRKIVKKIYKELLLDEEVGPKLIGKLKSQGVRQMDDSAMIMRIKFTTLPGEQFVMRKEILKRLQEAFRENNIEFAHRNVTVYMPPENNQEQESNNQNQPSTDMRKRAAATAAILNEEEKTPPGGDVR